MKYAKWTVLTVILVVAASAAWAGCGCHQQAQCPAPCPVACPAPCPAPAPVTCCPQPVPCCTQTCPCPNAVPAAMGAGPAVGLQCLGCNFDPTYATRMFAQYSDIVAVTEYGMQHASDGNLRDISGEIHGYMVSASNKLQGWYTAATCGTLTADCGRAQEIISQLSANCGICSDKIYARTLSEMLRQANTADTIAGTQATNPDVRQQAQFLSARESNWSFRLDRWVGDH